MLWVESIITESYPALRAQSVLTQCVQFHLTSSHQYLESGPHKAPDFIERFGCCGLFLYLWLTDRNDGPQSELIISPTEQLSIWKSALTIIYNISILYQSSVDIRCLLNLFILCLQCSVQTESNYISTYLPRYIWHLRGGCTTVDCTDVY